jgi:hypothetical protein
MIPQEGPFEGGYPMEPGTFKAPYGVSSYETIQLLSLDPPMANIKFMPS